VPERDLRTFRDGPRFGRRLRGGRGAKASRWARYASLPAGSVEAVTAVLAAVAHSARAARVVVDHAYHVVLDSRSAWPPDSRWFIFSACSAAAAAVATGVLAALTWNLARATSRMAQKTSDLAEQTAIQVQESATALARSDAQHQQSLWPYCVPRLPRPDFQYDIGKVDSVPFEVENIGGGLALYAQVFITELNDEPCGFSTTIGPIAPQKKLRVQEIELRGETLIESMVLQFDVTTLFGTVFVSRWTWRTGDGDWFFYDCDYPSIQPGDYGNTGVRRVITIRG
jgi:hypothetical protein